MDGSGARPMAHAVDRFLFAMRGFYAQAFVEPAKRADLSPKQIARLTLGDQRDSITFTRNSPCGGAVGPACRRSRALSTSRVQVGG